MFLPWFFFWAIVKGDTSDGELLQKAREENTALKDELAQVRQELEACREAHRRDYVGGDDDHLETHLTDRTLQELPMWFVVSGNCVLRNGCLSSPRFPSSYRAGSSCNVTVTPAWRGYLWVEWFNIRAATYSSSNHDALFVDGRRHDGGGYRNSVYVDPSFAKNQASSVHGAVPTGSIVWSADSDAVGFYEYVGWKICQEEAPLPPWTLIEVSGEQPCFLDRAGCLSFGYGLEQRDLRRVNPRRLARHLGRRRA